MKVVVKSRLIILIISTTIISTLSKQAVGQGILKKLKDAASKELNKKNYTKSSSNLDTAKNQLNFPNETKVQSNKDTMFKTDNASSTSLSSNSENIGALGVTNRDSDLTYALKTFDLYQRSEKTLPLPFSQTLNFDHEVYLADNITHFELKRLIPGRNGFLLKFTSKDKDGKTHNYEEPLINFVPDIGDGVPPRSTYLMVREVLGLGKVFAAFNIEGNQIQLEGSEADLFAVMEYKQTVKDLKSSYRQLKRQ